MKKAKYLIEMPYEGGVILYNTLFGSVIKLNNDYQERFRRILAGETNGFENEISAFLGQKMIYKNERSETRDVNKSIKAQTEVLHLAILSTTACNMQCVYCFEHLKPISADENLAKGILSFISRYITTPVCQNRCQ